MAESKVNDITDGIIEANLKASKIIVKSGIAPYDAPLKTLIPLQAEFEVGRITITIGKTSMILFLDKVGHVQITFIK